MRATLLLCTLFGVLLAVGPAIAGEAAEGPAAEQQIRAALKSYVEAFNRGDAAAVAAHWSEQAEHVAPDGQKVSGRKAIQAAFAKFFAENKGLKLKVDQPLIRLEKPELAIEEGAAVVTREGKAPELTRYLATHVKEDGKWKLKSVEEVVASAAPSHHDKLAALDWMVGEWVDQSDDSSLRTVCQWTKNKNFLTRSFQASIGDQIELEGTQVVGWDPIRQTIRSWVFDSDGGFGVGLWQQKGDRWIVKQLHVLADGRQASATNVIKRVDDNTCTWQSIGREVDGQMLPNVEEVTIVRAQAEQAPVEERLSSAAVGPAQEKE
jgi:uncharacterized protein (TIGR02246 family)